MKLTVSSMNKKLKKERRVYQRYDSELSVYFNVNYDLKTKVVFWLFTKGRDSQVLPKYFAVSKNVSAQGLCFHSDHKLRKNTPLFLEVYLPKKEDPVMMTGAVRWCKPFSQKDTQGGRFYTGIKLLTVYEKLVAPTIYFDQTYKVVWSNVLESVFGSYREAAQK